jgi:probable F420-dependent oxidoreductase
MKVDANLDLASLAAITSSAAELDRAGFDGVWSSESAHDPFLPLMAAAQAVSRAEPGTSIAVAFARTPMTVAYTAHDLQGYSRGRFLLGLGSQVKPHIERRFGMPWSHPAARMREFIAALHAIWDSWEGGTPLSFRGDFYQHTLMTPFFSPPAHGYPRPKVILAAVGETMSRVAGDVADGIFLYGFTTERYIREVSDHPGGRGRPGRRRPVSGPVPGRAPGADRDRADAGAGAGRPAGGAQADRLLRQHPGLQARPRPARLG